MLLWISDDDGTKDRAQSLVQLCLAKKDDDVLLLTIFVSVIGLWTFTASFSFSECNCWFDPIQDLVLSEETDVSCRAASILEQVAVLGSAVMRGTIGQMIKYNIPRFLRLTDAPGTDYGRSP